MVSPYAAGPAKVKVGDPLLREGKTGTLEHRLHTRVRDDCCMYCHACVCCAAPPSPCLPSTLTIHSTPPLRRAVTQRCRCSRGLESVQQSAGGRLVEPVCLPQVSSIFPRHNRSTPERDSSGPTEARVSAKRQASTRRAPAPELSRATRVAVVFSVRAPRSALHRCRCRCHVEAWFEPAAAQREGAFLDPRRDPPISRCWTGCMGRMTVNVACCVREGS
jgi:hypothetical protein